MTVSRCPFCGALLDVEWSRWHAPKCPNRSNDDNRRNTP